MTDTAEKAERALRAFLAVYPDTAGLDEVRTNAIVSTLQLRGLRPDSNAQGYVSTLEHIDAPSAIEALKESQPFLFERSKQAEAPSVEEELAGSFNGGGRGGGAASELLKRGSREMQSLEADTGGNPWLTGNRTAQLAIRSQDPERAARLQREAAAEIQAARQARQTGASNRPRSRWEAQAEQRKRRERVDKGLSDTVRQMGGLE